MSAKFVSIETSVPLSDTIPILCNLCRKHSVPKALVVLDQDHFFWGLLTMECILETARPTYMRTSGEHYFVTWNGLLTESCQRLSSLTAGDVADRQVPKLGPDDRVVRAIDLCLKTGCREMPVLEDQRVVGLVSIHYLIQEVHNLLKMSGEQMEVRT